LPSLPAHEKAASSAAQVGAPYFFAAAAFLFLSCFGFLFFLSFFWLLLPLPMMVLLKMETAVVGDYLQHTAIQTVYASRGL
jgi:hypothetical protein